MLFNYPINLSLSKMAIWIDENAYKEDCNYEMLFEYLYHIFNVLSKKYGYFHNYIDYEDFSMFASS